MLSKVKGLILLGCYLASSLALADNMAEINQQTQNPVASLVSVPFQNNWTFNVGPEDRTQYVMNLQPVIPYQINSHWNLITRMVMPVISQPRMAPTVPGAFGLGGTALTFFLSPISTSSFIWGIGPVVSLPATDHALGSSRFGLGPSIVALMQKDSWTVGVLANQIWSLGGTSGANAIDNLFVQPFISKSLNATWNIAFTSETTYNWNAVSGQRWTIPLDLVVVKLFTVGKQIMSVGAGPRYFAKFPGDDPRWGVRLVISLLFPTA